MKRIQRTWFIGICAIACLVCVIGGPQSKHVLAQTQTFDDGLFTIFMSIDSDSNNYIYVSDYLIADGGSDEEYDVINGPEWDLSDGESGDGDSLTFGPVAPGNTYTATVSYAVEYAYDYTDNPDGEGECYAGQCSGFDALSGYVSINIPYSPPQIQSISPSSANQGDQGTLTINGTNLVETSADQLTINYSGSGMPFTLTGTPSSSTATFSYDFTGYDVGTYTLSVTNNEGTSNSETFTVNPPLNACTQSTVPNSVTLQITGSGNQSGTFTVSHPTVAAAGATTTVSYGPFSTPSSVASNIASVITRNYAYLGVTAQSDGPTITLQSRSVFGTLSSPPGGGFGINIGVPSSVSCLVLPTLPTLPCTGLVPNYDVSRTYSDGVTETARQHILRKHILGTPTLVPRNTIYTGTNGPSSVFTLVQLYNFTTVLLNPLPKNGVYSHTFSKHTITNPDGTTVDFGWIGNDASGKDLYTNKLYLTKDRCTVNTSFPVE